MQVENEYGAHAADKNHMKTLKQVMYDYIKIIQTNYQCHLLVLCKPTIKDQRLCPMFFLGMPPDMPIAAWQVSEE